MLAQLYKSYAYSIWWGVAWKGRFMGQDVIRVHIG